MNLEGKILNNRYEILKQTGSGGMATVYKAKCQLLNRYVAVKVLRDEYTTDEEFIKRFNSEAQAAASLTHPNIVGIYDVGHQSNLYYIVMELIKGKTLKEIITADGILPWKWSVNIAIQIVSALEFAHKNNIVHRDIKPHNIIITEDGVAKVTDFGIARAISNSTITSFGSTMGSVHYFSPEHAKGGYTDAKSDIYSLGVVMYEMLTGKVPFEADTPVSIALKHMQEEPIEPIKLNPAIPISLNNVIKKAMQKDPGLRYNSAEEMLKDLKETLKNPEGNFVKVNDDLEKTQRINIATPENIKEEKVRGGEVEKKEGFFKRHKFVGILLAIIALIAIFFGTIFGAYSLFNKKGKEVLIPNLVGMDIEEAVDKLTELNLLYDIKDAIYSDTVDVDLVISQDPPFQENYNVKEGSTVSLVASKGKNVVVVPKVSGIKADEATQLLEQLGLKVIIEEENSDKVEVGFVIKQEPVAEIEVAGGSEVTIYVSKGVKTTVVPVLVGKTLEEAKKAVADAKLKLITKTDTDTTKNENIVLKQSLENGTEVPENSEITLTINDLPDIKTGKVNIDVLSFTGYTEQKDPITNEVINPPAEVEVMVKVTSQGTEDTVYKKMIDENIDSLSVDIQGVGTVTVKVYISGVLQKTNTLNLNDKNPTLSVAK